jgi:predicted nucleic acid-binding protein
MFRFEHRRQKLATRVVFLQRVGWSLFLALGAIGVSLAIGIAGYMGLAGLSFVDAFLNAAMILGGMGPVAVLDSDAAKVFAGLYALYAGLLFIAVTGVVLAPVLHRVLHAIHADEK